MLNLAAIMLFIAATLLGCNNPQKILPDGEGIYESCHIPRGTPCIDNLKKIAMGGFKLVLNYDQLAATASQELSYADQAHSLGLKIIWAIRDESFWENPTDKGLLSHYTDLAPSCHCTNNTEFVRYIVNLVKNHPATWGYYVGDEVVKGEQVDPTLHQQFKAYTDVVKQVDPAHPRLLVLGSTGAYVHPGFRSMADTADVLMQDYYPVGDPTKTIAATGTIAADLQNIADQSQKSAGMVLQAHSLGQYSSNPTLPYPTIDQMRQMRDLTLDKSKARLILWYSFFDIMRSDDPTLRWNNLVTAAEANQYPK